MYLKTPIFSFSMGRIDYHRAWGITVSWGKKKGPLQEGESNYLYSMGVHIHWYKF